jgi:hypothetical protein
VREKKGGCGFDSFGSGQCLAVVDFMFDLLTLKMKVIHSFRTSGSTHLMTVSDVRRLESSATLL